MTHPCEGPFGSSFESLCEKVDALSVGSFGLRLHTPMVVDRPYQETAVHTWQPSVADCHTGPCDHRLVQVLEDSPGKTLQTNCFGHNHAEGSSGHLGRDHTTVADCYTAGQAFAHGPVRTLPPSPHFRLHFLAMVVYLCIDQQAGLCPGLRNAETFRADWSVIATFRRMDVDMSQVSKKLNQKGGQTPRAARQDKAMALERILSLIDYLDCMRLVQSLSGAMRGRRQSRLRQRTPW